MGEALLRSCWGVQEQGGFILGQGPVKPSRLPLSKLRRVKWEGLPSVGNLSMLVVQPSRLPLLALLPLLLIRGEPSPFRYRSLSDCLSNPLPKWL